MGSMRTKSQLDLRYEFLPDAILDISISSDPMLANCAKCMPNWVPEAYLSCSLLAMEESLVVSQIQLVQPLFWCFQELILSLSFYSLHSHLY